MFKFNEPNTRLFLFRVRVRVVQSIEGKIVRRSKDLGRSSAVC